jgi:hypothetical protein
MSIIAQRGGMRCGVDRGVLVTGVYAGRKLAADTVSGAAAG